MNQAQVNNSDFLLFDEALPISDMNSPRGFKSECIPDKKVKVDDLFKFRRGGGDLQISIATALIALFFFFSFWAHTGWGDRKLPDEMGTYIGYQLGLMDIEVRVVRFGRILKQPWVIPMLCLLVLIPTAVWNMQESFKVYQWRKRFMLPTSVQFELSKYVAAFEFVAYFILYTFFVPVLGYLLSTMFLGTYMTWRLGYRNWIWVFRGALSSFAIVIIFRTFLQIKTPGSIWIYDQLPTAFRTFMLTYF